MTETKEDSFLIKYRKEIFIGLIATLMLIFIVQNSDMIEFQMLFIKIHISLIFLITLFFGLGMLTVWIRFYYILKDKKKALQQLEDKIKKLEEEKSAS